MAACGRLSNIFEKPLPEIPTLRQSLSPWKHLNSLEDSSFSLSSSSSSSSSSPTSSSSWTSSFSSSSFSIDFGPQLGHENLNNKEKNTKKHHRHSDSFSSMNSCTEGLGFESYKDIEAPVRNNGWRCCKARKCIRRHTSNEYESVFESKRSKRSRITGEEFPPPISSIGRSGKPWLSLKSYRHNGRFILKEVRIPVQEFLHACREDGRLKLHFIQSDDETIEEDEEEGEEEDDDDDEDKLDKEDCGDERAQNFDHGFDLGEEDEGDNGNRNVEDEDRGEF